MISKIFFTTLVFVFAAASAQQYSPLVIKARCTVVQVGGGMNSYLPPKVGDVLVIDTTRPEIREITFLSKNMIPLQKPLRIRPAGQWTTHQATFVGEFATQSGFSSSVILQISRLSNNKVQAVIQDLHRSNLETLWSINQIVLVCQ